MELLEHVDDPVEREILLAETIVPYDEEDVHDAATRVLYKNISAMVRICPPHHLLWARKFLNGQKTSKIAEDAQVAVRTVSAALKKDKIKEYLGYLYRAKMLESGPTRAQKAGMLWRIAKREEINNPRISITAVDVLNKQAGDYAVDMGTVETGLVIKINNFTMNTAVQDKEPAIIDQTDVVDAVFTPITVKTDV